MRALRKTMTPDAARAFVVELTGMTLRELSRARTDMAQLPKLSVYAERRLKMIRAEYQRRGLGPAVMAEQGVRREFGDDF